ESFILLYLYHRNPPSFPTRRSSDLRPGNECLQHPHRLHGRWAGTRGRRGVGGRQRRAADPQRGVAARECCALARSLKELGPGDRALPAAEFRIPVGETAGLAYAPRMRSWGELLGEPD